MTEPDPPVLAIVAGQPGATETAAVTVVLSALAAAAASGTGGVAAGRRSPWLDRARLLRSPVHPGPGAWRASGLPR